MLHKNSIIKPVNIYGDVIAPVRCKTLVPICAWQACGEYSIILTVTQNVWINVKAALPESLLGLNGQAQT